jgi:hypothetical protein
LLAGTGAAQPRTLRALGLAVAGIALTAVAVMSIKADADITTVLQQFDAAERASLTRWNEAVERVKTGDLKESELADILERDVIPPYKKMRQDMLATKDIPQRLRPLFERLDDYTAARIAAWDASEATLRQPDPEKRKSLADAYQRREAEVTRRLAAVEAESRKP